MGYKKMIWYGDTLEIYDYEKNLTAGQLGLRTRKARNDLSMLALDRADTVLPDFKKRQDNAKRSRMVFLRLVLSQFRTLERPLLITFTYAENMQDLRRGYEDFNSFIRAMRLKFGVAFSYISVPEFQKRGAVHFHALFWGLPLEVFTNQRSTRVVDTIWGRGHVFMKLVEIHDKDGKERVAGYLAKYMSKAYTDPRLARMKAYTASRNCYRPLSQAIPKAYAVEEDYGITDKSTCKEISYMTQWLGKCRKKIYKLNNFRINMRIILTHKQDITSKSGKFVKIGFIDPVTGKVDNLFLQLAQFEQYTIPTEAYLSKDLLQKVADSATGVEADFDNRGQLVSLK